MGTANMKVFICLTTVLAAASAAAQIYARPAVLARPAGQVSHQSVSKPFQGEHRSTVQSKAFGAGVASVADAPNRLHGARGVIAHPVAHAIARPVAVAHAVAPTVAVAHPVAHAIARPVAVAHAPAYAAADLAEVSPYSYNYAVADDYSGAAFNQAESNDGNGVVEGSYSVNLPDGVSNMSTIMLMTMMVLSLRSHMRELPPTQKLLPMPQLLLILVNYLEYSLIFKLFKSAT